MLKNYLKVAVRSLINNKIYTLINIFGLAVGISCTVIILLYIQDQLSYDKFYKHSNEIYRLNLDVKSPNGINKYSTTSAPMGPALVQKYPEYKEAVRVRIGSAALIQYNDIKAYEENILFVDSNFFDLFSFNLNNGNPAKVLAEPNTVVLTDQIAKKYFGNENPIGKTVLMDRRFNLKVTGVLSPEKQNSHIKFDFLISFSTFPSTLPPGYDVNDWGWTSFFTYLRLDGRTDKNQAEAKLPGFIASNFNKETAGRISLELQPVTDIYFDSDRIGDFGIVGNKSALYILGIIAVLSLLIACFNFINLSTARSSKRGKEVGLRKVLGAQKTQLISQFIGESIIIAGISVILSIGIFELSAHAISNSLGINVSLKEISFQYLLLTIIILPIIIGTFAGIYPAFVLSKFLPSKVLKGNSSSGSSGIFLRRFLVVSQFTVSTVLILGTFVIALQMDYIRNKNLGFDKEQIIDVKLRGEQVIEKYDIIKNAFLRNSDILSIGGARNGLDGGFGSITFFVPGGDNSQPSRFDTHIYPVQYNFFETLDMKFIAGRSFNLNYASDSDNSLILNEAAVKQFGLKDPIGKQIRMGNSELRTIVGVVEDFHYTSLHNKISPLVFYISTHNAENMFIKLKSGNIQSGLNEIQNTWKELLPEYPLEFSFLDEKINSIYKADLNFASLINLLSTLAVFIACLGLFGLTSYMIEQRTKEIGIRKVLGASITNILFITTREFIVLVALADIIAWPLAYYFLNNWLNDFAYRININWWVFVSSGIVAVLIALATVSFQAIKAAVANPVEALRYE